VLNSVSANEAQRFGVFFKEMLHIQNTWKADKKLYDSKCQSPTLSQFWTVNGERLPYNKFVQLHDLWMRVIAKSLLSSLKSTDPMEVTNALFVLTKIANVFPRLKSQGDVLDVQLGKIMKSPQFKKSAIKILATRVQAILTAERKNWVVDTPPQPPAATSAPNGTNGNVPPAAIAAKTTAASTSAAAAKSNAVTTGAPPAKVATAPAKSSPPSTTSTSSTAAASKPVASSGTPAKQANGTTSSTPSSSPTASGSRPTGSTPSLTIVAGSNKGGDRKVVFILFLVFLTFSYSSHFTRC
jgi:cell division septation protein DedD